MQSTANKNYLNIDNLKMKRIKCDLAHVYLPEVMPLVQSSGEDEEDIHDKSSKEPTKTVAIAKHLCGSGTDLALRSLASISSNTNGCAFATCCHGVCDWDDYVGRDYLTQAFETFTNQELKGGFSRNDFDCLRKWTSGSVHNIHEMEDRESKSGNIAYPNNQRNSKSLDNNYVRNIATIVADLKLECGVRGLGRACQRLIDYGRMEYMKNTLGFMHGEICHYVDEKVTPQNALLIAWDK